MVAAQHPMERGPVIGSVIFHALIAAIFIIGLPHLKPPPLEMMQPIPIDILELGPVTTTSKVADSNIAKPAEASPQPVPPTPPQQKELPTPAPPKPPAPKPVEAKPEPTPAEDKDADIPKTPPKKPAEKPKPIPADDSQQFSSLLKNLAVDKPQSTPASVQTKTPAKPTPAAAGSPGIQSDHLTISQEDALRRQIEQCWNVPAGGKNIQDIIVQLHIIMNPDRTVQTATINSVNVSDAFGRAMADAALRAVLNPKCSPFNLPEDKYDLWKEMTLTFNPKDML